MASSSSDPNDRGEHPAGVITNLPTAFEELLVEASGAKAQRAARSLVAGPQTPLKQTLLALISGTSLQEHDAPTVATLQILHGRVRLVAGATEVELANGDHTVIPAQRHHLDALEDAVVLLSVVA